ncbi:hypothetical protein KI688_008025 [Linnemannia hyalina]|uniref:Kazal-like domain-containing protein n=1 Tax=Linnemannia hyalina TaxID=64524 RepID=A0A9P7XZL4_9FUNG|nr:hypothetical protein KI688_008025 [Linnemannia hyalina]
MQFSTIVSLTVVASMTILSAMAAPAAPVCNKACAKIYKPVCAKLLSGENKTFPNACEMNVFNCENPANKLALVAETACEDIAPKCNKACTKIYAPVCAKLLSGESKTFGSKCTLEVYNCENPTAKAESVVNGECPTTPAPVCNKACPYIYKPVCAKLQSGESKTFGNSCEMSVFNCENSASLATLVAESACEDVKPAPVCDKGCTREYKPVCAKLQSGESKTFSNACTLRVFNCENPTAFAEVVSNGECPATPAPTCKKACNKMYAPVCAKLQSGENQTFANKCILEVFNCENPAALATVVSETACKN